MLKTNSKIELKRGILRICDTNIKEVIAELANFESFYSDVFRIYGVPFETMVIRQKRNFVAAVTKYFILDRLPEGILSVDADDEYSCPKKCNLKDVIIGAIDNFYEIYNNSASDADFKENFAKYYNEEVRDFSVEISQNRDDELSDFAKAIEKIAYSD